MRVPIETYKIVCDCCGETFENGEGWVCYSDCPNEIESDASDSGWLITADGRHYCPNCYSFNEDDEIHECKDSKRYNENYEPLEE